MSDAGLPVTVITAATPGWRRLLRDLWRSRELLGFLAWRDIRVRYRQSLIGAGWALIEPLVNVLLFTLLFHRVAGFDSGNIPYPLYCYAAIVFWSFFARALREATASFVANAALLRKSYFPRLVLPCAAVLAIFVDLVCGLLMYAGLLVYYGVAPGWAFLTLPLWVALAAAAALGSGVALASVNVRLRDISQALPFLVQTWMLLTPVAYPLHAVPSAWRGVYSLNPMVGVIEGLRWALLPVPAPAWDLVACSAIGTVLLLVGGVAVFQRAERGLADQI